MAETKKKRGRPRKKKIEEKPVVKKPTYHEMLHRIPNVSMMRRVVVYACSIGPKGYRFNTDLTKLNYAISWSKELTGIEAVRLLRKIRAANRENKLESRELPK